MKRWFAAVTAVAAVGLAGCSKQQANTLETGFENEIDSAQVGMRFDVDVADGQDGHVSVRGPYERGGDDKLERFDGTHRRAGARHAAVRAAARLDR